MCRKVLFEYHLLFLGFFLENLTATVTEFINWKINRKFVIGMADDKLNFTCLKL